MEQGLLKINGSLAVCRASLPGSGFATADIVGNYQGVAENIAHTRILFKLTWISMLILDINR